MITTSRYSSRKTREFAKLLSRKLDTFYVARGKKTIEDIVLYGRKKGESEVRVIEEEKGIPAYISTIEISETGKWKWAKRVSVEEYEIEIRKHHKR